MIGFKDLYRLSLSIVKGKKPLVDSQYKSRFYKLSEILPLVYQGLDHLKESFPNKSYTWYARALTRALVGVRKVGGKHWVVRGFKEFGDVSERYNVVQLPDGKYVCDCYSRSYGYYRRGKICTHIAAVILARKMKYRSLILYI
ncbi:MAG: hypothetical protein DRJ64_06925 [Thermoprotei archaeon]|nr:MAG: hypothetical protein DRJ64_06925 [Thermoprotei archaeon]